MSLPAIGAARGAVGDFAAAVEAARAAPYLSRLLDRDPARAARLAAEGPSGVLAEAMLASRAGHAYEPLEAVMARLRRAKADMHLSVAIGDLAGAWRLEQVTGAIAAFADAALGASLAAAAHALTQRGELLAAAPDDPAGPVPGLIILAMGKLGAFELNYSSDVDLTVFFDAARLAAPHGREPQRVALRLVQILCRVMEEITADGYVFRTDLRLRPDPASTPPAVSLAAAERYYQTLGQNWERAAFIKARPCAGDRPAGDAFLQGLTSFLWRRHLDFAAIADIRSIKRQIAVHKAGGMDLADPVFDVKVGRGGIRDIELHAQTQQLILGGRKPALRAPRTLDALDALVAEGSLDAASRDRLNEAYRFLRALEHRIQMLGDEQTHSTPTDPDQRLRLASLCGFPDPPALFAALETVRRAVVEIDARLFPPEESLADPLGSLAFTGVEDNPDTLATLAALGFTDPAFVSGAIRGFHHGRARAMRSERARELLTALTPKLLRALAQSGEPDAAFRRFADFLSALPAGVQALSLLNARPALLDALAALFALAAPSAQALARRAATLDVMLEPRFAAPVRADPPGERAALFATAVAACEGFEAQLNAIRRLHREEAFRIDAQLLLARASPAEAGAAHADLAEACVEAAAAAALAETARRFGAAPDGEVCVLALGKFGGRELAEGSDLDVMVVYDPAPNAPGEPFARFTQRLVTALSAPTEEGALYAVDMQLRPSGSKGPAAVRLSAFERYYDQEAWTWELMALTRLRAVAGAPDLRVRAERVARAVLLRPRDRVALLADVADMRARMDRERPGKGLWDLKLEPGGLVDVEFIAQGLMLARAGEGADLIRPNTGDALAALAADGALGADDAALLTRAFRLYSGLQQVLRIAVAEPFRPEAASEPLKARLAAAGGACDFPALEASIGRTKVAVRAAFARLIGDGAGREPR